MAMLDLATILFSKLLFCTWMLRAETRDIPQVGPHFPVFTFEKNENPQNIMVIYVRLDADGKLKQDPSYPGRPFVGFYWMMNREKYKPVHPLIQSGIRGRMHFVSQSDDRRSFRLRLDDLKGLKQDLSSTEIGVQIDGHDNPRVEATVTLGPSDDSLTVKIDKILSHTHKTFLPPFRKVDSVTIVGKTVAGGDLVSRTYSSH
ncbi:MAG: hypothetical protein AB7H97_20715 [Pseudobdellovibrionaceae bacterium]